MGSTVDKSLRKECFVESDNRDKPKPYFERGHRVSVLWVELGLVIFRAVTPLKPKLFVLALQSFFFFFHRLPFPRPFFSCKHQILVEKPLFWASNDMHLHHWYWRGWRGTICHPTNPLLSWTVECLIADSRCTAVEDESSLAHRVYSSGLKNATLTLP